MYEYLKRHEEFIKTTLSSNQSSFDWNELEEFHSNQIRFLQHERLVHLLVTLFFSLFLLATVFFVIWSNKYEAILLGAFLLMLVGPYTAHYYRLENGVQRWYHLANLIRARSGKASANYEI